MSVVISRRRRRRSATEWVKHSDFQRLLSRERLRKRRDTCWRATSSEGSRSGEGQRSVGDARDGHGCLQEMMWRISSSGRCIMVLEEDLAP